MPYVQALTAGMLVGAVYALLRVRSLKHASGTNLQRHHN